MAEMGSGVVCENADWVCNVRGLTKHASRTLEESSTGVMLRGCGLLLARGSCWCALLGACLVIVVVSRHRRKESRDEPQSLSPDIPHAHGSPLAFQTHS